MTAVFAVQRTDICPPICLLAPQAGTPVGLVCEEEGQVEQVARAYRCPTTDVYDDAQPSVPVLTWQSHLAKGTRKVKCMG